MVINPKEVLEGIVSRGWYVYDRGPVDNRIPHEEMYERGPVQTLEEGRLYIILPTVENPTDRAKIDRFIECYQVSPSIEVSVPEGFDPSGTRLGRKVCNSEGEDVYLDDVYPGEKIEDLIGFELRGDKVRLLSPVRTYISSEVFVYSLRTLPDITRLGEAVAAGQLNWVEDDGSIRGALDRATEETRPFREFIRKWLAESRASKEPFITD